MSRHYLTKEQLQALTKLWDEGMKSTSEKTFISRAVETGDLNEKTVKNWIGNEKKKRGLSMKRQEREKKAVYVPGQIRKKSAYSVFKSRFLASDEVQTLITNGAPPAEIQKQGNASYRQLSASELKTYQSCAEEANSKQGAPAVNQEKIVKKVIKNIHANMKKLDEMGCPSIWLGYNGERAERQYSPQMSALAQDATFTNYVVSTMVNRLAQVEMEGAIRLKEDGNVENGKKKEKRKRKVPVSNGNSESGTAIKTPRMIPLSAIHENPTHSDTMTSSETAIIVPEKLVTLNEGDQVEIIDDQLRRVIGWGKVTGQEKIHGRDITRGWCPIMVLDIEDEVHPWDDYPCHSGLVEKGSFTAWPISHLKLKGNAKKSRREVELLKDTLHPDKSVSPGTLMSRERQLRTRLHIDV